MRLKYFGFIGTIITALCCFTPILISLLAAIGLSWLIGYLDYVLFPTLAIFVSITVYTIWKNSKDGE